MKLLIADDHTLFRDALVQYIERIEPEAKIALARDMHEVMEVMGEDQKMDLILLDLRMPGMSGLQGLKKLKELYPDIAVALMSGLAEAEDVEKAFNYGAVGYFPKTMSGKAMIGGIKQIMKGEIFMARDHNTNEIMPSHYGTRKDGGAASASALRHNYAGMEEIAQASWTDQVRLTPREKEVLNFLMRGSSNKEIARQLELQVVTVKLHVRGICRKLGAKNRTQAVVIAREKGL